VLKKLAAAGALAVGALLMNASGVAHADDVVVRDANGNPLSWSDQASCDRDGPHQHLSNAEEEHNLQYWHCELHDDGLWYLHNTDTRMEDVT
jgi:hypothetical protein